MHPFEMDSAEHKPNVDLNVRLALDYIYHPDNMQPTCIMKKLIIVIKLTYCVALRLGQFYHPLAE